MKLTVFIQMLERATNIAQLKHILTLYLEDWGISVFSFTYYSYHPNSKSKIKYDCASENLHQWHEHYLAENYDQVDTTLDNVYREVLPVYWTIEQQIQEAKGSREKQMRLDSQRFGTQKGLSIPIHGAHNDFANLMVEQVKGQTCLENWQNLQYELHYAAYCFYHHIKKHLLQNQPATERYKFSKREIQCLSLVAQHHSVSEMAKTLKISERTVNFHIQNINKKLGTNNKYQSVAKVIEEGLLVL